MNITHQLGLTLPLDHANDEAKTQYLAILEGFIPAKPARKPKPSDQLIYPAERVQIALNEVEERARTLAAVLDAPVFLPSHRASAARAARELAKAAAEAQASFRLVKGRCMPKQVYDRPEA